MRADVEDFLRVHPEVTASRVGDQAVNDKYFVAGLRKGRQPRESTVLRVRMWIADDMRQASARDEAAIGARKRVDRTVRDMADAVPSDATVT